MTETNAEIDTHIINHTIAYTHQNGANVVDHRVTSCAAKTVPYFVICCHIARMGVSTDNHRWCRSLADVTNQTIASACGIGYINIINGIYVVSCAEYTLSRVKNDRIASGYRVVQPLPTFDYYRRTAFFCRESV